MIRLNEEEKLGELGDTKVILVDELTQHDNRRQSLNSVNAHCVVFCSTSSEVWKMDNSVWKECKLTPSLRATREISNYCEKFRKILYNGFGHLPSRPMHNLTGSEPIVEHILVDKHFSQTCFEMIKAQLKPGMLDAGKLLVAPYQITARRQRNSIL